jgi:hypothetical protein
VVRSRTYFPTAAYRKMKRDATGWRRLYYGVAIAAGRVAGSHLISHVADSTGHRNKLSELL